MNMKEERDKVRGRSKKKERKKREKWDEICGEKEEIKKKKIRQNECKTNNEYIIKGIKKIANQKKKKKKDYPIRY